MTEETQPLTPTEARALIRRREVLLGVIADSYRRMATNTSVTYRAMQHFKCQEWLEELTEINRRDPLLFNLSTLP